MRINADYFYLPSAREDFIRSGIYLYITGLIVTLFYYQGFDFLSIHFLKPQAIIIGLYVWVVFVLIPRLLLLLIHNVRLFRRSKLISVLLFFIFQLFIYLIICRALIKIDFFLLLLILCIVAMLMFFHLNLQTGQLFLIPPLLRVLIFLPVFCFLFANTFFAIMPNHLCGAKPVKVEVIAKDSTLLQSRFTKSVYLLYETESEFIFLEKRSISGSDLTLNYVVKRVPKGEIKKIEYTKSVWQNF